MEEEELIQKTFHMSSASSTPSQPIVKANTDTTHNDPLHLHYMILDAGAIIKGRYFRSCPVLILLYVFLL